MNIVERFVDKKLRRSAWKRMVLKNASSYKKTENRINQYRWIIKSSENETIYDSEIDGYEGLNNFPVVIESLELITNVEKKEVHRKKVVDKPEVIFTFDPQLWSIFPYEELEKMCIS